MLVVAVAAGLFAIADVIGLPRSVMSVGPQTPLQFLRTVAGLTACFAAVYLVKRRMDAKPARLAAAISRAADGLRIVLGAALLFTPLTFAAGIFMYMAAAIGWPLMDANLAALDRMLGFDWPSFLAAINDRPLIAAGLSMAYHTTGPQIPILFLWLGMSRREERLYEYVALIAVSSILTGAVMALTPAAGAYALFTPSPETFSHFTASAGMWHYDELMRLRSGRPFVYDVTQSQGLVTFPSYHTVLAIITSYAARDARWVFVPVAILNAVVVVSTIPEGGHYLIDVVAGGAIALVSILFVRAVAGVGDGAAAIDAGRRRVDRV